LQRRPQLRDFGVALGNRTGKIFFDCNQFAEINAAALVDDAKAADTEDILTVSAADKTVVTKALDAT